MRLPERKLLPGGGNRRHWNINLKSTEDSLIHDTWSMTSALSPFLDNQADTSNDEVDTHWLSQKLSELA
jgi:hypothetical protein